MKKTTAKYEYLAENQNLENSLISIKNSFIIISKKNSFGAGVIEPSF